MRLSRSKVLIAGGAGFIGSTLIERLLTARADITATLHENRPVIRDKGVKYIKADLTREEDCKKVVKSQDYVFMCAANTSGAAEIASNPLVHLTPNVVMNSRMLEASYLAGVGKFVWISSSVGYPPSGRRAVKEGEFFEGHPPDVYFASGWMKRYTEILCKMYSEKLHRHLATVVVRPSNIYGPRDKFDLKRSHVTAALVRKVVERRNPLVVWGDGNDARDLIYIDDFIGALLGAAETVSSYDPVNIASGAVYTVKQILHILLEVDRYRNARVVYDESKPSMIPVRVIDVRKARSLLGFCAKTTLREGLRKTVEWYRDNRLR